MDIDSTPIVKYNEVPIPPRDVHFAFEAMLKLDGSCSAAESKVISIFFRLGYASRVPTPMVIIIPPDRNDPFATTSISCHFCFDWRLVDSPSRRDMHYPEYWFRHQYKQWAKHYHSCFVAQFMLSEEAGEWDIVTGEKVG